MAPAPGLGHPGPMAFQRELEALRTYLDQQEYPRLQMMLMVSGAGLAGFLADVALRRGFGLDSMAWRYGLSVLAAYGVFIGLLRLWLSTQGAALSAETGLDAADVGSEVLDLEGGPGMSRSALSSGWTPSGSPGGGASEDRSGSLDLDLDLDEGVAIALVIAAVVGLVVAAGWLVTQAPTILAELALDGALSAGLYRRLRKADPPSFLGTVLRLTVTPFLVVGLLMAAAGWGLQAYAPEAHTLRGAYEHWLAR